MSDINTMGQLEDCLRRAEGTERRELFSKLSQAYAQELSASAIKWAVARRTAEPIADGQEAFSRAFILLAEKLHELDFSRKTLLYLFKGKIWSELGHLKAQRHRDNQRLKSFQIDDSPASDRRPNQGIELSEQLAKLRNATHSAKERRLLQAWLLQKSGWTWTEAAETVSWPGSRESLRVSCSRLIVKLKTRGRGRPSGIQR